MRTGSRTADSRAVDAHASLAASLALLLMLSAGMFKRQIRWKPRRPRHVRVRWFR
jgi:hypothetical protein